MEIASWGAAELITIIITVKNKNVKGIINIDIIDIRPGIFKTNFIIIKGLAYIVKAGAVTFFPTVYKPFIIRPTARAALINC